MNRKEFQNFRIRSSEDLCALAEELGYKSKAINQLQCNNGAFVSSLLSFFDDNPGAMEAVVQWMADHYSEENKSEYDEEDIE